MTGNSPIEMQNKPTSRGRLVLMIVSIVFIIAGLFVGFDLWSNTNNATVVSQPAIKTDPVPIAEVEPAGSEPSRIQIPAIGIDANVIDLGLNRDRSLAVPTKYKDVGWYEHGVAPGEVGPAVMVGHLDSIVGPAVFWDLDKLKPNDEINIVRSDGSIITFLVSDLASYPQDQFPTDAVYGSVPGPELRIITCDGKYNFRAQHYSHNLVVFAKLANAPSAP